MKFILRYWAIIAFVFVSLVSVVSHAYFFGVYTTNIGNKIETHELRLDLIELKQIIHTDKLERLETARTVQEIKHTHLINLLEKQEQSLKRIEDFLLNRG